MRFIGAFLLPFVLVYAHGAAVAWCIYLWEWEDIVTHYCQQYSTDECDGKAYMNAVLDHTDTRYPALPHAPTNIQEMRSVAPTWLKLHFFSSPHTFLSFTTIRQNPRKGWLRGVFRPPAFPL